MSDTTDAVRRGPHDLMAELDDVLVNLRQSIEEWREHQMNVNEQEAPDGQR